MKCTDECVLVLLSSYNGSAYILQQILSIQNQVDACTHLLIRDDGSTDTTIEILRSVVRPIKDRIIIDSNIGIQGSFFKLLQEASEHDFKYICTSDQDDIWYESKISDSLLFLKTNPCFSLYSTTRKIFPESIFRRKEKTQTGIAKNEWFLFENTSYGNTQFFTIEFLNDFLQIVGNYDIYLDIPIDLNIARFASLQRRLFISSKDSLKYRLHEMNATGIRRRSLSKYFLFTKISLLTELKSVSAYIELVEALEKESKIALDSNSMAIINSIRNQNYKEFKKLSLRASLRAKRYELVTLRIMILLGFIPKNFFKANNY